MAASNRTNQSSKGNKKNLSQNTNPSSNQNEQEELVSKGGPQWDGVIFNGKIFENCTNPELYKKALNFLATGEYKRISLEMKTCRDPRVEIWGMRVNDTIRFLGTTVPVDGKNYFYVLDVLPNHEYENNSYMEMKYSDMENFKKSPIIQKYVREQLAAAKTEIIKQKPVINIKESVAYIGNKFLQFDHKQTEALNRGTRFIGAGAPSSGKSVIAINLFKNYLKNLEYQNKTPQGLIYYVTQAQDLVDSMQEIWDHSNASNQYQVKFISCENLLKQCYPAMDFIDEKEIKERIRNSINIKKFNIDKNKKYSNKKLFNKDLLSEKIIYEEFRTMEGYTPEEYKKGIGERKSTFGGNDDPDNLLRREYLLEKRKAFMDALKKDGKMHAEFAHLPDDMNIEFGIGDECQDFSPAFIKKFIELTKGNFVFLGDENQNIFWARPVLDYIKKCVRDLNEKNNLKMDLPIIHLPFTHLISKAVKNAANRLLLMMNWLTGGLNHHGQYTEIQTLEYGVKEGKEEWVVLEDGNSYGSLLGTPFLEDLNAKIRNKPLEYLVVIPDKADVAFKALAEKLFPDAIILDIAQAKGQHYKKTIFLGPLDRKEHQNKFEEANAKLKGITPENITISKNLADRNVTTSEEVSNFFTGITRAIEDIIVIQEMRKNDKGQFINNNIINFLKPKKEELKEVKEVTQSIEIANTPVQSTIEIEINNPIEKTEADNTEYHYLDLVDGCKSLYKKSPEEAEKFYNKYIKLKYHPDTTFADFINPPQEIPQSTLAEEQASLININTNANAISADDVIITNETVAEENISQSKKVSANNQRGRRGRGRGGRQTERNAGRTANKSVQKSINEKSSDFATPLRRAIDFGDIAVIKQLLQNPNLDVNNIEYKTADAFSQMHSLEYVINCGNTESFCLLFNDPRIVLSEAQQNDIFNNRDSMEKLKFSMKQILNLLKACTKKGYTRVFETLLHFEQEKDGVHGLLTYISKHEYDKNIIMLILNAITKNHEKTILDLL
ncbi:MAG: hypothetical protein JO149_07610, partial [Gammaproteobacteria bacterium]|nr:hypothetical protein [Gammaproteobacteria bacterium]